MSAEPRHSGRRVFELPVYSGVGQPLNRLLITLMTAMGLSKNDWERDNVRGFGTYEGDEYRVYRELYAPLKELLA